jgi:hypothetical protein
MAIDLDQLKRASQGEPTARVTVNKAWLAEVYKLLVQVEQDKVAQKTGDFISRMGERFWGAGAQR